MDQKLLTTKEASERLNMSINTLNKWRCQGRGLPFVKMGRAVRYRESDVVKFIKENVIKVE